jgi:alanyl-tRNA synthetase
MTSQEIRQQYLDYFVQRHGHTFVPSSPVVPLDDPTLLFANAGMNQFKPIFLGLEKRPYVRAVNTQKCIRAGGKHNDLDDVGHDAYHHTFFEMLGNWSFGDYYKNEAILWAWDLLTSVWKLDKSRLHVTVFMGDPAEGLEADREASGLWRSQTDIDPSHIHLGSKKDNFWEMGDTGPCGPNSEIHYDQTPDASGLRLVNAGDPRVIEIWNLVFIQYNRGPDGRLAVLPAKHVDTGMGFERITRILQGNKLSNYDTDIFAPLMDAAADLAHARYTGSMDNPVDVAFRVIADHARMATFAITDGAFPGNKGRNSVLRSVIRRAVRYGWQMLNLREPFLHKLTPVVVSQMGDAFPELRPSASQTAAVIRTEEEDFLKTVDRGLAAFEEATARAQSAGGAFSGDDIFYLHATLGFPADMTIQMTRDRGLRPDVEKYQALFAQFQQESGRGRKTHAQVAVDLSAFAPTDDSPKYAGLVTDATVLGWVSGSDAVRVGRLDENAQAALILDRTSFYAEQGGQVGDAGEIRTATGTFEVTQTERKGDCVLHWGSVADGHIEAGQRASAAVDPRRLDTMRNHTATHLLNWALRKVLGDHVEQKGSLVDPDKLRFDFSQPQGLTSEQVTQVEQLVNDRICGDEPVTATVMPLAEAKKIAGVRAVFGEKYPDPVRVIAIGADDPAHGAALRASVEFCGGTHLSRTGQAGFFKIIGEEAISKGVRRLTAVTGRGAVEYVQKMDASLHAISQSLSAPPEDVPRRIAAMQEEIKSLKKKLSSGGGAKGDPVAVAGDLLARAPDLGAGKLVVGEIPGAGDEQLRSAMDSLKKKSPSHAILLGAADEQKCTFVAAVSDDLIAKGLKAGDWVREAAKVAGGGGGGRPQMAQAGGKDPAKLGDALEAARAYAGRAVK